VRRVHRLTREVDPASVERPKSVLDRRQSVIGAAPLGRGRAVGK